MEALKFYTRILWYQIRMFLSRMKKSLMSYVFYILVLMVFLFISLVKLSSWFCRVIRQSHICLFCPHGVVNLKSCALSASIFIKNKLRLGLSVVHAKFLRMPLCCSASVRYFAIAFGLLLVSPCSNILIYSLKF